MTTDNTDPQPLPSRHHVPDTDTLVDQLDQLAAITPHLTDRGRLILGAALTRATRRVDNLRR